MFPFIKKTFQFVKNIFPQDRLGFEGLTIPPKRRILGVACGTMFMAVGLDQLFVEHYPSSSSLFLPDFESELETAEPMSGVIEDWEDKDGSPVGRMITEKERERILMVLGESADLKRGYLPGPQIPLMILHDTAGQLSREELNNRPKYSHSPLGDGVAAYVPRQGEPIVVRSVFFTPYRPTATAYEKGLDFMQESDRNRNLRQVWKAASPKAQQTAINQVVNALTEKPNDLGNRTALWFKTGSDAAFDAYLSS